MEIVILFSKKPNSPNKKKAIRIAEINDGFLKDDFYIIKFEGVTDDLRNLLDIVSGWSTTEIRIDGKEIEDVYRFKNVLFCIDKMLCNGVCKHIKFGWRQIKEFLLELNNNKVDKNSSYIDDFTLSRIIEKGDFLKKKSEKEYLIDKNVLKEFILKEYDYEFQYCDKINKKEIDKLIEQFPQKLIFQTRDEASELRSKQFEEDRIKRKLEEQQFREENEFEGFTKYDESVIRAKARIYAEEIVKLLKKEINFKK